MRLHGRWQCKDNPQTKRPQKVPQKSYAFCDWYNLTGKTGVIRQSYKKLPCSISAERC